jgi:glycosyltransferase involved in cell wall biosynthesis
MSTSSLTKEQNTTKVLHVTYDMRIGGAEMVIKNIIEGNQDKSIEMSIFCIKQPIGPWGIDLQNSGLEIASVGRKDGFDFSVVFALRKYIKTNNIDIVHCHQYTPWAYGCLAALATNTKVIFTEHGRFYPDYKSPKRRFINPILAKLTFKMTAISNATKQALVDNEYLLGDDISVIYNGIRALKADVSKKESVRSSLGFQTNDIVFGTIARLDPIKNHKMMIAAFADLIKVHQNAKLLIVGDGELMGSLKTQVSDLKVEDNVKFTGYISYPKDHLNAMDVFLLPSLSEGTSMTLLEAMSMSKPCIVTEAGGNPEIVEHNVTGFVTENDNQEALCLAMQKMIEKEDLMSDFSEKGLERFNDLFKVEIMSERYRECYKS